MAFIEGAIVIGSTDEIAAATTSLVVRDAKTMAAIHLFFESSEAVDRTIGGLLDLKRQLGAAADRNEKPVEEVVPA